MWTQGFLSSHLERLTPCHVLIDGIFDGSGRVSHSAFFHHTLKAREWGQKEELISFFNQKIFSMGVINNNLLGHSFFLNEVMLLIGIIFELCVQQLCALFNLQDKLWEM